MFQVSPQVKLYIGIFSLSFFPIAFYFLSSEAHPLLGLFFLFLMVSILSTPGTIRGLQKELKKNQLGEKHSWQDYFLCLRKTLTVKIMLILILISLVTISGNFLVFFSLSHGLAPAVAQAVLRTETIFVSIGGILIFKEYYPRSLPWVILLIGIGFIVMSYDNLAVGIWTWENIYVLHIVLASICYGSFQILSKFIINDINLYLLNGLRSIMNCLILLPWAYPYFSEVNGEVILFAFLSALAGPFLGRNIILSCTREIPLNYIGCNLSAAPILSLGLQWLLLHNLPTSHELIGGGVIILSVLLFNLTGRNSPIKNI